MIVCNSNGLILYMNNLNIINNYSIKFFFKKKKKQLYNIIEYEYE